MSLAVVINTACLGDPRTRNSQGKSAHAWRSFALRNFLLPSYVGDMMVQEVIVVGEFEPGEGYTYINVPSVARNCTDALAQRQVGFEATTAEYVAFQHDDHWLPPFWWKGLDSRADVLSPARFSRKFGAPIQLNNGEPSAENGEGYISGHCAVFKRKVLLKAPWSAVPKTHTWDVEMTKLVRDAGFSVQFSEALKCFDVELE